MEQMFVYLDDIVVWATTTEEHIDRLETVFSKLRKHGLKIEPSKCKLFRESVPFLGHVISANGVSTDNEKTSALHNWPAPRTLYQLRSFLGFASYYRRF